MVAKELWSASWPVSVAFWLTRPAAISNGIDDLALEDPFDECVDVGRLEQEAGGCVYCHLTNFLL